MSDSFIEKDSSPWESPSRVSPLTPEDIAHIEEVSIPEPGLDIDEAKEQAYARRMLALATALVRNGYSVIPLVVPGTKIKKVINRQKTTVAANGKEAALANAYDLAVRTEDAVSAWWGPGMAYEGHGVGIVPGQFSECMVLDVDHKEDESGVDGVDRFRDLVREHGDIPATFCVESPSGGIHIYFKYLPGNIGEYSGALRINGKKINWDWRAGQKGHIVAPMVTTLAGEYYFGEYKAKTNEFYEDAPTELCDIPEWLKDLLFPSQESRARKRSRSGDQESARNRRSRSSEEEPAAPTASQKARAAAESEFEEEYSLEDLRDMLRCIDPTKVNWMSIVGGVKDHFSRSTSEDKEAYKLLDEWSAKDKGGYDPAQNSDIWDRMKESSERSSGATIGTVIFYARQGGWRPKTTDGTNRRVISKADLFAMVRNRYAVVDINRFSTEYKDKHGVSFYPPQDLTTNVASDIIFDLGTTRPLDFENPGRTGRTHIIGRETISDCLSGYALREWNDRKKAMEYKSCANMHRETPLAVASGVGIWFDDKRVPPGAINRFKGWPEYNPDWKDAKCTHFLRHIKYVLCSAAKDEEQREKMAGWVMDRLAHMVQRNDHQYASTVLVLVGGQGCGKGLFMNYLSKAVGRHNAAIVSAEAMGNNFNVEMEGKVLFCLDESDLGKDAAKSNAFKQYTGNDTIRIEPKGVDPYVVKNVTTFMVASNSLSNAVMIEPGDRRFTVLQINERFNQSYRLDNFHLIENDEEREAAMKANEHMAKLVDEMNNGGPQALHEMLMGWDLNKALDVNVKVTTEDAQRIGDDQLLLRDFILGFLYHLVTSGWGDGGAEENEERANRGEYPIGWGIRVSATDLHNQYKEWVDSDCRDALRRVRMDHNKYNNISQFTAILCDKYKFGWSRRGMRSINGNKATAMVSAYIMPPKEEMVLILSRFLPDHMREFARLNNMSIDFPEDEAPKQEF